MGDAPNPEPADAEICGESYDHQLDLAAERDGWRTWWCRECGAEIIEEPDGE